MTALPTGISVLPRNHCAHAVQVTACRYSLAWLAVANSVGVILALLLVFPSLGSFLGEYTYGRWVAVHLNFQLYGWCSLPLVGVLLNRYLSADGGKGGKVVFRTWSVVLLAGGATWLLGLSSGKLFLEWVGTARLLLVGGLSAFWLYLAIHYWRRGPAGWKALDTALLVPLAFVPFALWHATQPHVYPAINPASGGPTAASLLGSTLALVLLFGLLPGWLGVKPRGTANHTVFWAALAVSFGGFLLLDHGNTANSDGAQLAGLGSLVLWVILLPSYLLSFRWQPPSRIWLKAMLVWWGLLVLTGIVSFLPGILELCKFTHVLVAHAHLAMAGMLTSLNMVILGNLDPRPRQDAWPHENRIAFFWWQAFLGLHLAALMGLGVAEILHPRDLMEQTGWVPVLLAVRLGAGVGMLSVSIFWTASFWKRAGCLIRESSVA